ncbi:hypothetical protein DMB92_03945 [Campylobacter sp. MIT 99-7217]|uniref:hypothetical protein n=1 Tax=Campylobacter sp. MIT 99-7217 TaxID=535091 RepID=UPI001157973F|nr:hypothetical protein [Campylobacter sp. MIT 99-7217]TQR33118.1 hypothetical protein DMB92_03945 [Campylobacter sp. MIT 99-7217]
MIRALEDSIRHFFEDILKGKLKESDQISGELYGASISLSSSQEGEFDFYLFFPKQVFEKFRKIFLKNITFDESDWCDLAKEMANEIIGHAKLTLKESNSNVEYKLGIPEYLGRVDFSNFKLDKAFTYDFDGDSFRIGYRKNG